MLKRHGFLCSVFTAMDAYVLYLQSTTSFPSWTSRRGIADIPALFSDLASGRPRHPSGTIGHGAMGFMAMLAPEAICNLCLRDPIGASRDRIPPSPPLFF